MKSFFISVSLALLLSTQAASAQSAAKQLQEVGFKACEAVLYGQEATFGEKYYLRFADLVDMDREDLCACVGRQFVNNEEEQKALMKVAGSVGETQALIDITKRNLDSCLPDFDELEPAIQGMIMRGAPEGSHEMAEAQDASTGDPGDGAEADEQICKMITTGKMEVEVFDADYLARWEEQSELKAVDMCGECVATMMADRREEAIESGSLWKANDENHRSNVAGAIIDCMRFTYTLQ